MGDSAPTCADPKCGLPVGTADDPRCRSKGREDLVVCSACGHEWRSAEDRALAERGDAAWEASLARSEAEGVARRRADRDRALARVLFTDASKPVPEWAK